MTSSNGNIFRVTGPLYGEFTVTGEFPSQRPVTRSFDVFFDLCLKKRLSKQSWGWWFETPSRSLCRHRNEMLNTRGKQCSSQSYVWLLFFKRSHRNLLCVIPDVSLTGHVDKSARVYSGRPGDMFNAQREENGGKIISPLLGFGAYMMLYR